MDGAVVSSLSSLLISTVSDTTESLKRSMRHVEHLRHNKKNLQIRGETLRLIREFFWSQQFLEVDAPQILRLPGQEPYLNPMRVLVHDERGWEYLGYLHTSPEYTMKKMLTAGYEKIFSMQKCFRDYESMGGTHNPEFMMIEWYRTHTDYWAIMDDTEALFSYVAHGLAKTEHAETVAQAIVPLAIETHPWKRMHMREVWSRFVGVDLDEYLTRETMYTLCVQHGYAPTASEAYADLFYRIFLNEVEPELSALGPVFVYGYPAPMAALARLAPNDERYAQRFELYIGGMELANCFGELTDHYEQQRRLEEDREERHRASKDVYPIDTEFIDALRIGMPESSGIALGVDRMVQLFTGCLNIDDVLVLPMSKLFL